MKNGYHSTNKGNESLDLLRELSGDQTRNGHIRFATAYSTPDGIVVEIYGSKSHRYVYPHNGRRQEKIEMLSVVNEIDEADGQINLPLTIRTLGDVIPVSKVRITPVSRLGRKEREIWMEDVEGIYRDDPRDGSHYFEHLVERLSG